jgi:hypothetical protein
MSNQVCSSCEELHNEVGQGHFIPDSGSFHRHRTTILPIVAAKMFAANLLWIGSGDGRRKAMMKPRFVAPLAALLSAVFGACGQGVPTTESVTLLAAQAGTDRPFKGTCTMEVRARVHGEDEGECGGCGGGSGGGSDGCGDEGGTPPIPRHFELVGTCQLTHLGLVQVTGRMNLTGPFSAHQEELIPAAHGRLGVRGRLNFMAANGDQLGGSYVPVSASFSSATGRVQFTSTQTIGASCSDLEGGGGEDGHDEPTLTGRFFGASGQARLLGDFVVSSATKSGFGTILLTGLVSY